MQSYSTYFFLQMYSVCPVEIIAAEHTDDVLSELEFSLKDAPEGLDPFVFKLRGKAGSKKQQVQHPARRNLNVWRWRNVVAVQCVCVQRDHTPHIQQQPHHHHHTTGRDVAAAVATGIVLTGANVAGAVAADV